MLLGPVKYLYEVRPFWLLGWHSVGRATPNSTRGCSGMTAIKRLEEIAKEDFEASPYWMLYSAPSDRFAPDTVLIPQNHPDYDKSAVRLIRTVYTLNSGLTLDGFLYENPPQFERHTIFIKDTGFETWYGIVPPTRESINFIYDMLQLESQDVFPIAWQSHGNEYAGSIAGFGYVKNGSKTFIK